MDTIRFNTKWKYLLVDPKLQQEFREDLNKLATYYTQRGEDMQRTYPRGEGG